MLILLLFTYATCAALGMVLMKKGGSDFNISILYKKINIELDYRLFLGIVLYVISFVLLVFIIRIFPVVYIAPISFGLYFIFTAFFAYVYLKEKINLRMIIGVITIVIGVVLVSFKF